MRPMFNNYGRSDDGGVSNIVEERTESVKQEQKRFDKS
jgi:hypothetical protein